MTKIGKDYTIRGKRAGKLLTLTVRKPLETRTLTIDLWAAPEGAHDVQQWLLETVGRIWWDLSEPGSFTLTTRMVDEMANILARERDAWVQERKAA